MSGLGQNEIMEPNPLDPSLTLIPAPVLEPKESLIQPQKDVAAEDSAVTKAEKFERHAALDGFEESPAKRVKLDLGGDRETVEQATTRSERQKGVAPIKAESALASMIKSSYELTSMQVPRPSTGW